MDETPRERFIRLEQLAVELIDKLPTAVLGQVARMLAQNLIHHRWQTGIEIPIEKTLMAMNDGSLNTEQKHRLNAEALGEFVSLLALQGGDIDPTAGQTRH